MIAVCWKWVAAEDERWAGVSDADRAALEVALRLAAADPADPAGHEVVVVSLGAAGVDHELRGALAAGATRAVRVDAAGDLDSVTVARALAGVVAGADWVLCGDASADRGTGSVPAFLAAELAAAQALGLLDVAAGQRGVRVTRRLDGGRREVLDVAAPAVLSVEGSVARLRRAALPAELAASRAVIEVLPGPTGHGELGDVVEPYRPRPRHVPTPTGAALARVLQLTNAVGAAATTHELVTLDPPAAAERILAALAEWGYRSPAHGAR